MRFARALGCSLLFVAAFDLMACGGGDEKDSGTNEDTGSSNTSDGGTTDANTDGGGQDARTDGATTDGSTSDGGVDSGSDSGTPVDAGPPDVGPQNAFNCNNYVPLVDTATVGCADFNTNIPAEWVPESGTWDNTNAMYIGMGPLTPPGGVCNVGQINGTILTNSTAQDVYIRARLRSLGRPDKVIILRALDDDNRIELNFRGAFPSNMGGDLIVQERVNCTLITHNDPAVDPNDRILVPHAIGEFIDVEISLIGNALTVAVGGAPIITDRVFSNLTVRTGNVGVGVINSNVNPSSLELDYFIYETRD